MPHRRNDKDNPLYPQIKFMPRKLFVRARERHSKCNMREEGDPIAYDREPRENQCKSVHVYQVDSHAENSADKQGKQHIEAKDKISQDDTAANGNEEVNEGCYYHHLPVE